MTNDIDLDKNPPFINPFTDFGFKKLFGTEPNKELLKDFLNSFLPDKHKIQELSYTKNEQLGRSEIDRKAIFDLYCVSTTGDRFIVELQKAKQNYFKERSVYYSTFPIQEQAKRGDWDFNLAAVYTVGILDFVFEEDKHDQKFMYEVQLTERSTQEVFYDKLTFIYFEMPKFNKTEEELESSLDKWLFVLKHLHRLTSRPAKLQGLVFERFFENAAIAKLNPSESIAYEESIKVYRDLKNVIDTAAMEAKAEGREEGLQEGFEMGMEKGVEKGIEKGIEKGRAEGVRELVKNAKQAGISLEQIQIFSGLSKEEIEKI
jgi:predicted transposase/invertase (TIGR01784 family)